MAVNPGDSWRLILNTPALSPRENGKFALAKITSVGIGVPPRILSNNDLEKMVETYAAENAKTPPA